MPYMLAPGARLMVGPHGQLEESLGACCSSCASKSALAGPGAAFLSQIAKPGTALHAMATTAIKTGQPMPIFNQPADSGQQVYASPGIAPQSSSKTMLVVLVAGAIGLGAYYLKGRKRGRR